MQTKQRFLFFILSLCVSLLPPLAHANPPEESCSNINAQWSIFFHKVQTKDTVPHTICTIPLQHIPSYLPNVCHVKEKKIAELEQLREFYKSTFENPEVISTESSSPYIFFKHLALEDTYSYVLSDDQFIFTSKEEETCPVTEHCRANKHLFLSHEEESVRMAGEFNVYEYGETLYVVFNNSSGGYKPSLDKVLSLVKLFQENLNHPNVKYIGIDREEQFDLDEYSTKKRPLL